MSETGPEVYGNDNYPNNDVVEAIALDWRHLKSKRQKRQRFKDYQEQLLKEIPGAKSRTNVAMHAVIDGTAEGCENQTKGMGTSAEIRNQALIHYVARLASSNSDEDEFDFSFVESLLENGADINAADKYGQTMFHEVARSWNVDVARFLLNKGANINQQDRYGRAPLHVAAAVDYTEMIEFLLKNKAQIDLTTFGELQRPIHFAAKNDACQALKLLINYGASINCRDYQNRTPVQVAASMSRSKAARYLVELGAPTGVYDHNGEMTLSLLILKMPEVATIALDQFRSQDTINRKEYVFLNYIEGPRIFEKDPRENKARSPLEVAIQYEHYGIVMHPVMKRLINTKWENFGKKAARNDLVINLIFALVWTILGISMPLHADKLYLPVQNSWWRLLIAMVCVFLTGLEIFKQVTSLIYMNRAIRRWKAFREKSLTNDKSFCHPKWRDENEYLEKEIKVAREEKFFSRQDGWIFIDWTALFLILSGFTSHIAFLVTDSKLSRDIHVRIVSFLLIVLWVRLLKFVRPFEDPGPFVASISPMLKDFCKWSLLFCLIFIPYAAIFWMVFGPVNNESVPSLSDIPGLLFVVFTMAAFSNLSQVDDLMEIDQSMARILTSTFVAVSTIITFNLLIAMLADTFTRMYENSLETATMQRAKTILYIEQTLSSNIWQRYCDHVNSECSPEVLSLTDDVIIAKRDKKRSKEALERSVNEIHSLVYDRFSKQVGNEKSDMDKLLEGISQLNNSMALALQHLKAQERDSLSDSNFLSLNIVLEQPRRGSFPARLQADEASGEKDSRKTSSNHRQCFQKEKEIERTALKEKSEAGTTHLPCPSMSSSVSDLPDVNNKKILQQMGSILDLIKQAVKKGKITFRINRKALVQVSTQQKGSSSEFSREDQTGNGEEEVTDVSEKDWTHYDTHIDIGEDIHGTGNQVWPLMDNNGISDSVHGRGSLQNSSVETFDETLCNDSESQSSGNEKNQKVPLDTFVTERFQTRYEGSSFLSSSSEGNTTWDDGEQEEGDFSKRNPKILPVNLQREEEVIKGRRRERSKTQHVEEFIQARKVLLGNENTDGPSNSSESDGSAQQLSLDINPDQVSDIIDQLSPYDDDNSSSQASEGFNQELRDIAGFNNVLDNSSSESLLYFTPAAKKRNIVTKVPHVRWADSVDNPNATPFLHVREISTSLSDNYPVDARVDSDTTSAEESQSRIWEDNGSLVTPRKTDV